MTDVLCGVYNCIFNENETCVAEGIQIEWFLHDEYPSCVTIEYKR